MELMRIFLFMFLFPIIGLQANEILIYQKANVGPYANFNPISYYFNTAFDTIQIQTILVRKTI